MYHGPSSMRSSNLESFLTPRRKQYTLRSEALDFHSYSFHYTTKTTILVINPLLTDTRSHRHRYHSLSKQSLLPFFTVYASNVLSSSLSKHLWVILRARANNFGRSLVAYVNNTATNFSCRYGESKFWKKDIPRRIWNECPRGQPNSQ
jgi:hypothetical protein